MLFSSYYKYGLRGESRCYLTITMEQSAKSRGGRPRSFDRDRAAEIAMRLFWRHGYEGVSVGDLTEAIGVAAPSLYAAFGNKAELFREALRRYEAVARPVDLSGFDAEETLEGAARRMLRSSVRAVVDPKGERGCMIATGMIATGAEHEALARELRDRRDAFRAAIAEKLRRRMGKREAAAVARYLSAVMQGIAVQARDGATPAELYAIVEQALISLASRRASSGRRRRSLP